MVTDKIVVGRDRWDELLKENERLREDAKLWRKVLEIKAAYGRHDIYRESDALGKIFDLTREEK